MTTNAHMRETFEWIATIAAGTLLAARVARMAAETVGHAAGVAPVRSIVEDALEEHREDDTLLVQTFAESLEDEEEAPAGRAG